MNGTRKYALLVILLILATYANSFQNEFVWDDGFLILENSSIMSWKYAWIHFAVDLYHSFSNYYRPIQMITYMIDFSLWRLNPFGYHLTNTLLHIIVSLSLFMLLKLLTEDARIAFVGTLFYAVHPAHTAAVTYIAGRADLLATLFLLLSLLLFHTHFKTQGKYAAVFLYAGSLISFLLALLSKEIAVVFPAVILCYRLFFISDSEVEKSKKSIKFHYISWFVIILCVYLLLRIHALNFQEQEIPISKYSLYPRLLTSLKALGIYVGIVFLPLDLYMERSIPYALSFFERDVLISGLLSLFILWLAVRIKRISKPAFFGFLFFIISLLPIMNIYPLSSNMAEHWLYTPMVGISIFLSCSGAKLWDAKKGSRPFLLFFILYYLIFFSYRTVDRNFDWHDEYTIYTHTFNYSPKSIKIINNLGNLYHARGDLHMAIMFHKKALEINPKEYRSLFNLGRDYEEMGELDKALIEYNESVRFKPDYAKAHFHIGNIYVKKGEYDNAITAYQLAVQHDDFHVGARNNLGNIYYNKGLYEEAKNEYERLIKINPYVPDTHYNLGNVLRNLSFYEIAVGEFKEAVKLAPEEALYHFGLGTTYGKLGMHNEAIEELKEAYRLKPSNVEVLINLGASYFYKGDLSSAEKEWRKALIIDPQNRIVAKYLENISP